MFLRPIKHYGHAVNVDVISLAGEQSCSGTWKRKWQFARNFLKPCGRCWRLISAARTAEKGAELWAKLDGGAPASSREALPRSITTIGHLNHLLLLSSEKKKRPNTLTAAAWGHRAARAPQFTPGYSRWSGEQTSSSISTSSSLSSRI